MQVFFRIIFLVFCFSCSDNDNKDPSSIVSYNPNTIMDQEKNLNNSLTNSPPKNSDKILTRIAFGSCNHQDRDQSIWNHIREYQPDLWIWTGDVVYADTESRQKMHSIYTKQLNRKEYSNFIKTKTPIIGVWDDHDYGVNDGGKEFSAKNMSQELFLDFVNEPLESKRRKQEGVYTSYVFGPSSKSVKIILLDIRYHQDSYKDKKADILGKAQWKWLEKEIKSSNAKLNLVISGIQFIPHNHSGEKWYRFRQSRKKLFNLISKYENKHFIIISGDRHMAEISKMDGKDIDRKNDLFEITASGMTHSWEGGSEPNHHRVGNMYPFKNFGSIEIHWHNNSPSVSIQIRTNKGEKIASVNQALDTL